MPEEEEVQERADQDDRPHVGQDEQLGRIQQRRAPGREQPEREGQRDRAEQRRGRQDLAGDQILGRQGQRHQDHEPPRRDRPLHPAQHQQDEYRQQGDQSQVRASGEVDEHVGREPVHVATDQRRGDPSGDVAAEQEGRPGAERRRGELDHVPGHRRAEPQRDRRQQDARPRHRGGPGQVKALRHEHHVCHERVQAMQHGMRPPGQEPHELAGVDRVRGDDPAAQVPQNRDPEQHQRQQRVQRERPHPARAPQRGAHRVTGAVASVPGVGAAGGPESPRRTQSTRYSGRPSTSA